MKPYLLVFLCVSFWAGNFVIGRYLKDDFTPLELNTIRWNIVLLIILPYIILHAKRIYEHIKNDFLKLLGLSVLSVTLFNMILYYGLSNTESTNALIINLIVPIFILILSSVFLKTKIYMIQIIGIVFSIIGVLVIVSKGNFEVLQALTFNGGDMIIIVASLTWSLYSIFVNFRSSDIKAFEFFSIIVLLGTIILNIFYFIFGGTISNSITLLSNHLYPLLYISLLSSIASYLFWHYGLDTIGANKTSQFTYLMPLIGAFIAYLFLGEKLEFFHLIGMIFIAVGIYVSLFLVKKEN